MTTRPRLVALAGTRSAHDQGAGSMSPEERRAKWTALFEGLRERMAAAPPEGTLFINKSESRCGACGLGCDPDELTHETLLGYAAIDDRMEGCHARFVALDSDYTGMPGLVESITRMRPDLPYVGWRPEGAR